MPGRCDLLPRVCRYCPALITTSHPKVSRCSSPECKRAWKRDYMRQYQRDYAVKHGQWWGAEKRAEQRKSNPTCVDCGAPVGHGRTAETRCRRCWKRHLGTDRLSVYRRKLARAAEGTRGPRTWVAGKCWRCGASFIGRCSRYCSKQCGRRDKAATRRALEKGCKVTPGRRYVVYERDGWVCQICGDPVKREAVVPELAAAVIDHRVPLAAGGEHGPDNWQTAHFYCNSVKRDQVDFDFATAEVA